MKEKSQHITKNYLFVKVAVPTPIRKCFDYLPPNNANNVILQKGVRVKIPFGTRLLIGIIVDITTETTISHESLKPIIEVLDPSPIFPSSLQTLFNWASNYYQYSIGMIFDAALPTTLRKGKPVEIKSTKLRDNIPLPSIDAVKIKLNREQQQAIAAIASSLCKFKVFLLDGVTGSGKTEVYLQLIEKAISKGQQSLILIPEIGLTPQTLSRFQQRFSVPIVILHSKMNNTERANAWIQAKLGTATIVIGTRSAALVPLKNPGLFIVDEEHDTSFKQQEGFRYSARDLLIKRAQLENCPIILGSATPSLHSLFNVKGGNYSYLCLPNRAGEAITPNVQIIDIRHKKLEQGLSKKLLLAIENHLKNKGQVLLFINRRGYAPILMCHSCGWIQNCKQCDARMILHLKPKPHIICHHCQMQSVIPTVCPDCQSKRLSPLGLGTEKIEAILTKHFPQANIVRVDKDTTKRKLAMQDIVHKTITGEIDILIGTQMLAKGHHFTELSLVAIIDIDSAFFSTDFRAIERMGQLVTQVAGRAGRGRQLGQVIIQTYHPQHPLLQQLLTDGYKAFCATLLQERKEARLPPFSYQILFRATNKSYKKVFTLLSLIKQQAEQKHLNIDLLGPIPAPMEKKAGFYRAQLLLQSSNRANLHYLCNQLINGIENLPIAKQVHWSVDVDPIDLY